MLLRRERALTAVMVMLDVAFHAGRLDTVSTAEIAERIGQARRGIEPVLQALVRAGLLESTRGPKGGYRLARPRGKIALADVVAAVASDDTEEVRPGTLQEAVTLPLWRELEDSVLSTLRGISMDDLLKRAARRGFRREMSEPISFSI